jgi:hexosaminidase
MYLIHGIYLLADDVRVIWSPDPVWYLDNYANWESAYEAEPCTGLTGQECKLVLGGGGQMWGEHCDASNIEATIFPRLAAIAERLWTPRALLEKGANATRARIRAFRCTLTQRGVAAAPVGRDWAKRDAREGPEIPGSCYAQ